MSRRRDRVRSAAISLILSAVVLSVAVSSGAEVAWHGSFGEAVTAAHEAGKPMLILVHMGMDSPLDEQMASETLTHPDVVAASKQFECFELDLRSRANDYLREPLKVAPVRDEATGEETLSASYPMTLFLDSSGNERFRVHGSFPPMAYAIQLNDSKMLLDAMQAADNDPQNAVAHRELGRAYMEMYQDAEDLFYIAALEHLEKAIELDPNNATGANYDARVDLAIFKLPDDPEQAFADLFQLQTEDPERSRRFEIQYYMAVALFASGDQQGALQLLESFETADQDSPYFSSKWTALALAMLKYIREDMARNG